MRDLKRQIENITKTVIRKNGFVTPQIIFDWPLIVGKHLAEHTTPLKITFPAQKNINGTLHIEVIGAQAPIIQQLEYEIVEKISAYFGFKAVSKIRLIHARSTAKPEVKIPEPALSAEKREKLDKMLGGIEDTELKNTLMGIGRHIIEEDA